MRRLDGHVTTHDALKEAIELGCLFANDGFHGGRRVHVPEADLQRYLHLVLLFHTQARALRPQEPVSGSLIAPSTSKTASLAHLPEIGRAPGRERVGQYV